MSKKFESRHFGVVMEDLTHTSWLRTIVYQLIDSRYRQTKRLDKFLEEQVQNPGFTIRRLAMEIKGKEKNPDLIIMRILKTVLKKTKYVTDQDLYGALEVWGTAEETWKLKKGDCDSLNSLVYVLARLCGIPSYNLHAHIGWVYNPRMPDKREGHFWLSYVSYKPSGPKDLVGKKLVWIDATYHPSMTPVSQRPKAEYSPKKYQESWFIFSDTSIFKPVK